MNNKMQSPETPSLPEKEQKKAAPKQPEEIGGRKGPEPTRFGDWELKGKCVDF